jgi:hypothetical protein
VPRQMVIRDARFPTVTTMSLESRPAGQTSCVIARWRTCFSAPLARCTRPSARVRTSPWRTSPFASSWPNVTEFPSAQWTGQQIIEAFPEDTAPRYMSRDRDGIYGDQFRGRVEGIGIEEVLTAPRSSWQNPYAERHVGSVRRECLDQVIVLGERHLHRVLKSHFACYHRSRTHLSLGKDAPDTREACPSGMGEIVELPEVGGLHHRYERLAA